MVDAMAAVGKPSRHKQTAIEIGRDCNQRKFGTRLFASIHLFRTGLFAIETAFIQLGLQSTALRPD